MLHIEKIRFQNPFLPEPGLVDLVYPSDCNLLHQGKLAQHVPAVYGQSIRSRLRDRGIAIGEKHQTQGVHLGELKPAPNTVYEIGVLDWLRMPSRLRNRLQGVPVIITDLIEGGSGITKHNITGDFVAMVSGSMAGDNVCVPVFLPYVASTYQVMGWPVINKQTSHGILFLAGKARKDRITMLDKIESRGLLPHTTWSLFEGLNEKINIRKLYGLQTPRYKKSQAPFIERHQDELPKYNYLSEDSTLCYYKPQKRYQWYISCETPVGNLFATEKTFKAFASGIMPLTIADPGFNQALGTMGFQLQGDYDELIAENRMDRVIDIMQTETPDDAMVRHNQALMQDHDFISNVIVDHIAQILNYI